MNVPRSQNPSPENPEDFILPERWNFDPDWIANAAPDIWLQMAVCSFLSVVLANERKCPATASEPWLP